MGSLFVAMGFTAALLSTVVVRLLRHVPALTVTSGS